jgi:hypothetical protein
MECPHCHEDHRISALSVNVFSHICEHCKKSFSMKNVGVIRIAYYGLIALIILGLSELSSRIVFDEISFGKFMILVAANVVCLKIVEIPLKLILIHKILPEIIQSKS